VIRVMVIDDHELIREAVCSILNQEHDITVVAGCSGGQEALERLEQARPDVVVTDLNMPVLDGVATTAHIRCHHPDLVVVVLTATPRGRQAAAALHAGAHAVLAKGLDPAELVEAVRTVSVAT
jgi:two-component system, NarL family, response regulator DesR